jgi:hypothetical protein
MKEQCEVNQNTFAPLIMPMRKVLIPVAVVAVLAAAVAAWVFLRQPDSYQAVPSSAVAVVRVNSWNEFDKQLQNTMAGAELRKTEAYNQLRNELIGIASVFSGDKALLQEILSGNTVVSLHLTSANKYDFLFVTPLAGVNDNTILNNIQQVANVKSVNMRIFKGNKVLEVKLNNGSNITAAFSKGLLLLSYTPFLTESSLSVLGTDNNIAYQKSFRNAEQHPSNSADAELYINFSRLGVIWPVLIEAKYAVSFSDFEKGGEWGVFSCQFKNDEVRMSGAVFSEEEIEENKLKNTSLQAALPIIPFNAAVADIAVNDTATYDNDLTGSFFRSWAGDCRAFVTLEPLSGNYTEQNLLLIPTKNEPLAQTSLMNLLSAEGASKIAVDTFMNRPVFRMKGGEMLNRFFGNQFCRLNEPYFTTMNGAVVFANNADVMKLAIENISTERTLYKEGVGIAKQSGNRWLYINPQRSAAIINSFTASGSTTASLLSNFSQIKLIARQEKHIKAVEVVFKTGQTSATTQGLLWKLQLKTAAANMLSVIETNTESKEILAQDTSGNVYLINASGEILFTHYTGENIIGGVTQVDYYRNGGLQYLFNTASKIFLLDENGNDVAGYPLRLSSTATAGMTIWNDSTKKTIRYFIPCANGGIYGYELTGKPVPGWSPRSGMGVVEHPVSVFKHNGKDMLWACNSSGTLWLLDARGNKLWSAENMHNVQGSPAFIQLKNDFVFLSAAGNQLTTVNTEGVAATTQLMDSATAFTAFVESDSSYHYVYASGNAIRAYDGTGNFKASAGLKSGAVSNLSALGYGNNTLLLATDSTSQNLYLMNSALAVNRQISAAGLTYFQPVAIFSTKETVLIAVTTDGKVACIR